MAVAKLDSRNDSFIALLLDVSGKARPEDMAGMSLEDAAALLQAFAGAHPELGLGFDGRVLAPAAVAVPVTRQSAEPVTSAQEPAAFDEAPDVPAAEPATPAESPLYVPAPEVPEVEAPAFSVPAVEVPAVEPAFSVPAVEAPAAEAVVPAWAFDGPAPTESVPQGMPEVAAPLDAPLPSQPTYSPVGGPAPVSLADIASIDLGAAPAPPAHESVFGLAPAGDPVSGVPQAAAADYGVPTAPELGGYYGVANAAPPEYAASEGVALAPAGDNIPEAGFRSMPSSDTLDP